jgi:hypothetical protein
MERNCKRKEKKKKTKRVIFSLVWLYQPGLEVPAVEVVLEAPFSPGPHPIPINRPLRACLDVKIFGEKFL